jgi:phosphoribosylaminoimidazolecarboxamide formyltransferase/IMP cyclohydrolase
MRTRLARKGFLLTSRYDAAIAAYFSRGYVAGEPLPAGEPWALTLYPVMDLRYGENPHQQATLFSYNPGDGPLGGRLLHGKPLSYNNLLDLDAAWRTVRACAQPTVAIVKHLAPVGVASAPSVEQALALARACDPLSAFGGVVAANRAFDAMSAGALSDLFVECVAAPWFEPTALEVLRRRAHLRIMDMSGVDLRPAFELRSVNAGVLRQTPDQGDPQGTHWRVVSQRPPTQPEWDALRFAWQTVQMVKSNAIVFARLYEEGLATVGIAGGQPSRVGGVRLAAEIAGQRARGAVMASDAFFPFPDSIEAAAEAGITAIISPGGSVRDEEAVAAADAHEMAMIFTGVRHFRH